MSLPYTMGISSKSRACSSGCTLIICCALVLTSLVLFANFQNFALCATELAHHGLESAKLLHPLVPRLSQSNTTDGKALGEFFEMHACPSGGSNSCILDLLSDSAAQELQDRITSLRNLAKTIMQSKELQCGSPKILGKKSVGDTNIEFCFWKDDYVSNEAMRDFSFEASDWQWVVSAFNDPKVQQHHKCLAFLDLGVNVGDWATPITGSLPTVAYFGIEGSPPTAAISSANMLAMIHNQKYGELITDLAPRALVPFPVMSKHSVREAEKNGGVCFGRDDSNIGGQSITGAGTLHCDARSTAGAAYFPAVLKNLATQFQPSCMSENHWPSIYIAKFDIQGFEFQTLSPAIAWLEERPPCYMILEFENHKRQTYALMELLVNVVGYDSVWRSSIFENKTFHEQPPTAPHWTKSGTELWTIYEQDMTGLVDWSYINYIFGFADQEACIKRLLGHT